MPKLPFSRRQVTDPQTNAAIQDIYDKLAQLLAQSISVSSPVVPPATASKVAATLDDTGVIPGTYGDATHVSQITVDAKGRLTAAADVAITGGASAVIEDTHANRATYPAASYPNTLYWETDRTVYYLSNGVSWIYTAGEMKCTQATLPADLGANDRYFIADVADYNHRLLWGSASGAYASSWNWAPGDEGSGRIIAALIDPTGVGWHLCDGSAGVAYLKGDGTTATVTLPDLTSASNKAAYLKWGSPASAVPTAAVAPTLTMNAYTPAGTNSAPTFTGTAMGTHQHTLPFQQGGASLLFVGSNPYGTGSSFSITTFYGGAGTSTTGAGALSEAVSAGTPAGSVSAPTFTGTTATLTGTISATGEPRNVMLRPWFRQ